MKTIFLSLITAAVFCTAAWFLFPAFGGGDDESKHLNRFPPEIRAYLQQEAPGSRALLSEYRATAAALVRIDKQLAATAPGPGKDTLKQSYLKSGVAKLEVVKKIADAYEAAEKAESPATRAVPASLPPATTPLQNLWDTPRFHAVLIAALAGALLVFFLRVFRPGTAGSPPVIVAQTILSVSAQRGTGVSPVSDQRGTGVSPVWESKNSAPLLMAETAMPRSGGPPASETGVAHRPLAPLPPITPARNEIGNTPTPGHPFRLTLGTGTTLDMLPVRAGSFTPGTGEKATILAIPHPFWLGKYEVTQAQWKAVMGADNHPSKHPGDPLPVENISHAAAAAFCQKIHQAETAARRLPPGYAYALPTEDEWAYAARADGAPASVGWTAENSNGETHRVGELPPNAWGFHDMVGNVSEMCADLAVGNLTGSSGGKLRFLRDKQRITRGGDIARHKSSHDVRDAIIEDTASSEVGFRLALRKIS